jgi:hypothetical protein
MLAHEGRHLREIADHHRHAGREVLEDLVGKRQPVVLARVLQQRHTHVGVGRELQEAIEWDRRQEVHAIGHALVSGEVAQALLVATER